LSAALTTPGSWEPRLLERDGDLERLKGLLREARAGTGRTVVIEGAPGVGKSRLLRELVRRASRGRARALPARASELERDFPYGVVRQLFEPALAACDERERNELLRGPASQARAALGLRSSPGRPPAEPSSTLYGLYWFAVALAQRGPLLLAVDDVQWADGESLQFLHFVSRRLDGTPVLLALTSRVEEGVTPDGPLGLLVGDPATQRVEPAPLGLSSTGELLIGALGMPGEPQFVAACHEVTGGNPFLLVELARTIVAEGIEPTAANASAVRDTVPATIARAVLVRLGRLSTGAQQLARAIAILGDGCPLRLAAALAGLDPDAGVAAADELRAANVLAAEPPLGFDHPIVRNAVSAQIPASARDREHERAAALLEADGAPPERVAVHLLATEPSGDPLAAKTLRAAALRALDQGAPHAAGSYVRRALREPLEGAERADMFELLLTATLYAGDGSPDDALLVAAFDGLTADPTRGPRCAHALAALAISQGKFDEAVSILERAIQAADRSGDLRLAVTLETQLIMRGQCSPESALRRLRRYDGRLAEGTPERRLAHASEALMGSLMGNPASEVAAAARAALAGGTIFAEHQWLLTSSAPAIVALARAEQPAAAIDAAERLIKVAGEQGVITGVASGWHARAIARYRTGDLRSAEADMRQALEVARTHMFLDAVPTWPALLIEILVDRGELEDAEHVLPARALADEVVEGWWFGPTRLARGKLLLAQGRAAEAVELFLDLRERATRWGTAGNPSTPAASWAARALGVLDERERALPLAEEALATARRWGTGSGIAHALTVLGFVHQGERGIELLREAVEQAEASPARLVHATALTDLGAALHREHRETEAREPLRAGLLMARRCGAVSLAQRAAGELEATGVRVPRYTPVGADALSPRERHVAELAARGMTNREIAATLYLTIKTVESHLRAAYDKLGIRSRRELQDALAPPQPSS
jgi:DNA-binding CsgD family transcriptional regulator/tetratricopeptide (TPR) repeat protein